MRWGVKWLVLWSLWAARLVRQPTVVRRLQSGALLRGQLAADGSHEQYFGIPYATTPFRFQAPGPEPTWDGVFEAFDENVRCPQLYLMGLVVGHEDCLRLNVYVPLPTNTRTLPVMVFIHGGGFKEGSGTRLLYGPDYLVSRGVILVTINYRLNVHGFLCLGIKEAPGNAGLKDQVAALKWVQRNIRLFGGDPENVTIFGESAGGASVSYHLLSPMSKGLFHRGISQSGSPLAPWSRKINPISEASLLVKSLGHNIGDPKEIYNILINKSLSELVAAKIPKIPEQLSITQNLLFTPCTETLIDNIEPFLTDTPFNILSKGDYHKVPMIIGFNNKEGYFIAAMDNQDNLPNISLEESMPVDLNFSATLERQKAANELRIRYMDGEMISRNNILKLSEMLGDVYFKFPALIQTELILKTSSKPVYSYIFQYDGWRNLPKLVLGAPFWTATGASHADDLIYLFNLFIPSTFFETDTIRKMTTLWTNFAKYGHPTPGPWDVHWFEAQGDNPLALVIDHKLSMSPLANHRYEAMKFWRNLYSKYRTQK